MREVTRRATTLPNLCTLFAQVFDPSIAEDADACLLWIGTAPGAIPTVAALQAQARELAALEREVAALKRGLARRRAR